MNKVMLLEQDGDFRKLLARVLSNEGYEVFAFENAQTALEKLSQKQVDLLICSSAIPEMKGFALLKTLKELYPITEVIVCTQNGDIHEAVEAIKNGAYDYITNEEAHHKLIPMLFKACEKVQLAKRIQNLERQLGEKLCFDNIIGSSPAIQNAVYLAKMVAPTDTSVLLTGETGTGKEVFAQSIHQASRRNKGNFVAINCSAFSKDLLEGELFGHKAGAFTGATKDQKGLFEEANKGTIFLDEIGEMPLDLQAKLLRVLETGEFFKIGETKPTKVDVRIIAATNRSLDQEIEKGNFRDDLFYRISVFQIQLPPLRKRLEDMEALAQHFTLAASFKVNKKIIGISAEALALLKQHQWKGNNRELKNVMERAAILTQGELIEPSSLPADIQDKVLHTMALSENLRLEAIEQAHIKKVMALCGGNKNKAAELLGIGLTTLYRKLEAAGE